MSFSLSPSTIISGTTKTQKLEAKNAAHRLQYGSPKLRDQLREKCRIRMKEARTDFFTRKRNIVEEEKIMLKSIIREELANMDEDLELQEQIYRELIEEPAEFFYDTNEREVIAEIERNVQQFEENPIFCPLCEKFVIEHCDNIISCKCGMRLYYPFSLTSFYNSINMKIQEHGTKCPNTFHFFIEPKSEFRVASLNAMCSVCDKFVTIVD